MIFQSEVASHLIVTFVYFFIVSVLRFKLDWNLLGLWLGALLGTFFLDIDHLVYWFVTHPEKEDSLKAKEIIGGFRGIGPSSAEASAGKDIRGATAIFKRLYRLGQEFHNTHSRLVFHSVIGQIILFILAVYVLTSGGSVFGSAFIIAVNLHLLKDEWTDFFERKEYLKEWLFWQVREPKLREYLREYLVGVSLVVLGLAGLLIRGV